jgi:hypothetical protein
MLARAHGEFSILGVIGEQPTFQLLPHHRSFDREMERGRSARIQRRGFSLASIASA